MPLSGGAGGGNVFDGLTQSKTGAVPYLGSDLIGNYRWPTTNAPANGSLQCNVVSGKNSLLIGSNLANNNSAPYVKNLSSGVETAAGAACAQAGVPIVSCNNYVVMMPGYGTLRVPYTYIFNFVTNLWEQNNLNNSPISAAAGLGFCSYGDKIFWIGTWDHYSGAKSGDCYVGDISSFATGNNSSANPGGWVSPWTKIASFPNASPTSMVAMTDFRNGVIYAYDNTGSLYIYDITNDSWSNANVSVASYSQTVGCFGKALNGFAPFITVSTDYAILTYLNLANGAWYGEAINFQQPGQNIGPLAADMDENMNGYCYISTSPYPIFRHTSKYMISV